jgi:hypothetical protein
VIDGSIKSLNVVSNLVSNIIRIQMNIGYSEIVFKINIHGNFYPWLMNKGLASRIRNNGK